MTEKDKGIDGAGRAGASEVVTIDPAPRVAVWLDDAHAKQIAFNYVALAGTEFALDDRLGRACVKATTEDAGQTAIALPKRTVERIAAMAARDSAAAHGYINTHLTADIMTACEAATRGSSAQSNPSDAGNEVTNKPEPEIKDQS